MKNHLLLFVIIILILSGFVTIVTSNSLNDQSLSYSIDSKIIAIESSNLKNIIIDNGCNKQSFIFDKSSFQSLLETNKKAIENKDISKKLQIHSTNEIYDYIIVTIEDLYNAILSSNFIDWKTTIGYSIKIVYITDDEITSQSGKDLSEKIRNFLREYYTSWGIKYVLIVGDHQTIPMRYCYPDPTNHVNGSGTPGSGGGEVPTDYYYADLTSSDSNSWDSDGDGYYGEYGDDNPDFEPEVFVGRIPTSISSRITYTLDKIVSFEKDNGNWKNTALHAGAFYYLTNEDYSGNPAMDAARCMNKIEIDLMYGWDITHFSEQEGLETSIYDWDPLTYPSFTNAWRNGEFGIVNWGSHAYMNCAARKVWKWDDGDGVPESNEIDWPRFIDVNANLDDDYPSIVFAMGCLIGCPEPYQHGNLGIDLLTKSGFGSSVGIISSTRTPYGSLNWPTDPSGCESFCYRFNQHIINDSQSIGDALYNSKYYCHINYGWDQWYEYMNLYIFNLYGDPSLVRLGIFPNNPPSIPEISGPLNGKAGTAYNYSFVSTDMDNDNLSYLIEWGDGLEDVFGVYPSGKIVNISHTWNKKDNYTIRAKAIDENGSQSSWGTLKINMPKSKTFNFYCNPIEWLFKQLTYIFPIIRALFRIFD